MAFASYSSPRFTLRLASSLRFLPGRAMVGGRGKGFQRSAELPEAYYECVSEAGVRDAPPMREQAAGQPQRFQR